MKRLLKISFFLLIAGIMFAQSNDVLTDYRLKKVIFNGNTTFSDRKLKRYVDIKPVMTKRGMERITYRFIKLQAKSLKNYYISEGFLNSEVRDSLVVDPENDHRLHLYFNIKENERYYIRQISVEGNKLLTDGEILELLGVKVGEPFRQYTYYNNFKKILAKYSELGHPFAGIREEYDWKTNLEIRLFIDEDMSYTIDHINLSGNKAVKSPYIEKHYLFKEGDLYQLDKLNRTQDRIYEIGAFNSVNIMPVNPDTSTQTVDLNVSVIESKPRRFDFEFGAKQGYTDKISGESLYLKPEWVHKNLFGRAHRFKASLSLEGLFQNNKIEPLINGEIGYTVPWLISMRLPTTFKIYYDRNAYSPLEEYTSSDSIQKGEIRTEYGFDVSSIWRYNRNIYTRFSVSLQNLRSDFLNQAGVFKPQAEIALQTRFDNRDNFIYPTKGWNILLYGGYVLGTQTDTETEYFRLEMSISNYARLARNLTFASRFEIGRFFDLESIDPLVIYQLGSESTVRGWRKSIGEAEEIVTSSDSSVTVTTIYVGKAKILANVELRADLMWNFGVNAFLDVGKLNNDFSGITEWENYYVNTGFGIYYKTPIGPVRIEVPIILNDPNVALGRITTRTFWTSFNIGLLFAF